MSDHRLVAVHWGDACQKVPNWLFEHELPEPKPSEITTVGVVVREGSEAVVIASSFSCDKVYSGVIVIPRSAIREIVTIEPRTE
jgi:hypothetical protein